MKFLFTGFLPFSSYQENPTQQLAKRLGEAFASPSFILPVSYSKAPEAWKKIVEEEQPDFILSLGLHGKATNLHLEKKAYNMMKANIPDNDGKSMQGQPINETLPAFLENPLPLDKIQESLKEYPFELSLDPGRYICNLIYFLDLSSPIPSLFVHVPPFERIDQETQFKALTALVHELEKQDKNVIRF